jgi:hypothetical protein
MTALCPGRRILTAKASATRRRDMAVNDGSASGHRGEVKVGFVLS